MRLPANEAPACERQAADLRVKKNTPLGIGMCSDSTTRPGTVNEYPGPNVSSAGSVGAGTGSVIGRSPGPCTPTRRPAPWRRSPRRLPCSTTDYRAAFALLVAATLIDATDGLLARLARVKEVTPGFDGARLDDIVDYLTFVFVPALLLYRAGDLPGRGVALPWSRRAAQQRCTGSAPPTPRPSDHFFTGFPSYWNIVAVYLHAARLPAGLNAGDPARAERRWCSCRNGYVYPTRTPVLRGLTIALGLGVERPGARTMILDDA